MKIIYKNSNDAEQYDEERFINSLRRYDEAIKPQVVREALAEYEGNDVLHVSVLVEKGVQIIEDADKMARYFKDHEEWFQIDNFERLRRITGYLVGTLARWNDAKQAEEKARVKHSVNSSVDDAERLAALEAQAMERNYAYSA